MSSFGPPGSGSPDDPYRQPPGTPGGPPVDPTVPQWGTPPAGGNEPPTTPLWGQPPSGYPPPPGGDQPGGYPPPGPFPPVGPWGPLPPPGYGPGPVAPPAKRNGGQIALIVALVVVLLLCPCLALVGWGIWRVADERDGGSAAPGVSASAAPNRSPGGPPASPTRPSQPEDDDRFRVGDCVVNDGTDADAKLRKVPCGPNTYEILLRIPATTNGQRCEVLAPESTANYVHDDSIDLLDYVLCLKEL